MGRYIDHFDWLTALLLLGLGAFGLFLLLTIDRSLFFQQLLYLGIAGVVLVLFPGLTEPFSGGWHPQAMW